MKLIHQVLFGLIIVWSSSFTVNGQNFDGYALYNLQNQNTTYLIDKDGNIAHSWSCAIACSYTVLLKENGNIVRTGKYGSNILNGAAISGIVQEIDPNGSIVWEYVYSDADHCSHHDITLMPNGNVLLIAWEVKSIADLDQAGYDNPTSEKWPTHFIELEQDGSSAQIIWEWHIWDHLIQDIDPAKDNFGVIADHPELVDINQITAGGGGGPGGNSGDWFHVNGIDYNETLDQIAFSSRHSSEIFIIDHSTTTAEAATHSGGNAGMGGDILFRWGNPSNYGAAGNQTIPAAVHDVRWIEDDGRPNGGYIQFFNNEGNNGGSAVDAINPAMTGYNYDLTLGNAYLPSSYEWRHDCITSATGQSASDRLSNGNTFVNVSNQYMYEVDSNDNVVWQYNAGPTKAFRYECDHPGINILMGVNSCSTVGLNEESFSVSLAPNPSTGLFTLEGMLESNFRVSVFDMQGRLVLQQSNLAKIDLNEQLDGLYIVSIEIDEHATMTKKVSLLH